jgi:DNA-binding response OmpR family regulator
MRLLVVEDDIKIAAAIKKGLELKGYAVDSVHDADAGLAAALDADYDLVILDRMLLVVLSATKYRDLTVEQTTIW